MRSKIAQKIASETSEEEKIFMKLYADIVVRINSILEENGMTRQTLASMLGKNASEVSKWLNSDHNLTLMTISKLQSTLGQQIISVPNEQKPVEWYKTTVGVSSVSTTVQSNWKKDKFTAWERSSYSIQEQDNVKCKEYQEEHDLCEAA
ncbi:MAG: helix-turn-helix transcriptional regulator [Bacteroidia bacterium]